MFGVRRVAPDNKWTKKLKNVMDECNRPHQSSSGTNPDDQNVSSRVYVVNIVYIC